MQFQVPDVSAITAALENTPLNAAKSDKGRFFNYTWWPAHHKEVEEPVLKAIQRLNDESFDRRVYIMKIAERVDAKNGGQLESLGFTPGEITRYVTRAMNKRLKACGIEYVIRNNKLTPLALEHKPE